LEIPGLGTLTQDGDWILTAPRPVPILGRACQFVIDGFEPPEESRGLVACIEAFCSLDPSYLKSASAHVFDYYRDVARDIGSTAPGFPDISQPDQVWNFVRLTQQPFVQREAQGGHWFVALENECDWELEHGLMLVFKAGRELTKVSQYDGHLTNRHAFADVSIPEDAVYWNPFAAH